MRALLDLMRENEAPGEAMIRRHQDILRAASVNLEILDPEQGDEELINSVAAELAK